MSGFYRAFEERYRGAREQITDRLRAYAPFTAPLAALYPGAVALDLGCGRGEWLELCAEAGFAALGVDLDEDMLAACRERGLQVRTEDALATLHGMADDSAAMVSAFHLVEHLPFEVAQTLIAQALRVLKPGGLLIMETPNPENLMVGTNNFYLDPSHLKPVPSLLLGFMTQYAGFARNQVVRLQEDPRLHDSAAIGITELIHGVSLDYAIVAQKAAAAPLLAPFDAAFDAHYGVGLAALAQRYDRERADADERRANALLTLGRGLDTLERGLDTLAQRTTGDQSVAERRMALLEQRLGTMSGQLNLLDRALHQTQLQTAQLALALERTEQHAGQLEHELAAVHASSSWRITAPLRRIGALAWRARAALREGGLGRFAVGPARALTARVAQGAKSSETVRRLVIPVLQRFPALRVRVQNLSRPPQQAAAGSGELTLPDWPHPLPPDYLNMPESARRVLLDLARAGNATPRS